MKNINTPNPDSKGRVLVAMSGGIDSSLAAVLLHEQACSGRAVRKPAWSWERSLSND